MANPTMKATDAVGCVERKISQALCPERSHYNLGEPFDKLSSISGRFNEGFALILTILRQKEGAR